MTTFHIESAPEKRIRGLIRFTWELLANKVGNGLISINKEASLQLQYAYLLQQGINMIRLSKKEDIDMELETGVQIGNNMREIDVIIRYKNETCAFNFAIEMKCYKTWASSDKRRGATDIFMKDVYKDLELLEHYVKAQKADYGIFLMMTDFENFVHPKSKESKNWKYDISNGARIQGGVHINTPIGGKDVEVNLEKNYHFEWKPIQDFWFLELEGQ